jgi:hypothetical protein
MLRVASDDVGLIQLHFSLQKSRGFYLIGGFLVTVTQENAVDLNSDDGGAET